MKRTYITPTSITFGLCESEMIAGAGSTDISVSKGNVRNTEDIGFVKSDGIDSGTDDFWE